MSEANDTEKLCKRKWRKEKKHVLLMMNNIAWAFEGSQTHYTEKKRAQKLINGKWKQIQTEGELPFVANVG